MLAAAGAPPRKKRAIGTHSANATLLSWAAKYGLDRGVRRILGYHRPGKDQMANVYSRDAMATPLRRLQQVEEAIMTGEFNPDATRSGRFKRKADASEEKEWATFLVSKKGKVHLLREAATSSPCNMASLGGPGFGMEMSFPRLAKPLCTPCFKGLSMDEAMAKYC